MSETRVPAVVHAEFRGTVGFRAHSSGWEAPRGPTLGKNPVSNDLLFSIHGTAPVSKVDFDPTVYLLVEWNVKGEKPSAHLAVTSARHRDSIRRLTGFLTATHRILVSA